MPRRATPVWGTMADGIQAAIDAIPMPAAEHRDVDDRPDRCRGLQRPRDESAGPWCHGYRQDARHRSGERYRVLEADSI